MSLLDASMLVLELFRMEVVVILILRVLTKRMIEDSSCIEKQTADVLDLQNNKLHLV